QQPRTGASPSGMPASSTNGRRLPRTPGQRLSFSQFVFSVTQADLSFAAITSAAADRYSHAAVDFRNQHGHARHAPTLGPIAFLLFLRPHRRPMFLRLPAHGAHRNFNSVMLFQLHRRPSKGILGTKIGHGSL